MSPAPPTIPLVASNLQQHSTYFPSRIEEDQTWAQNALPRRTEPLAIDDLPSETSFEPIYGFSFVEKPVNYRVVVRRIVSAATLSLANFVLYMACLAALAGLPRYLGRLIIFILLMEFGPWKITQMAPYLSIRWMMAKPWIIRRFERLGITGTISWTTGRNICRFELQCVCIRFPIP